MKIGILGSGGVAQALGAGFLAHGYETMLGTREPGKLAQWRVQHPGSLLGGVSETAAFAEVVVLAVKGSAAAAVLRAAGSENLAGKAVIDATNPLADAAPVHGVLRFFTSLEESLMEQLQKEFPGAHLVKAFNSVGSPQFDNPRYREGRPTMFICGQNEPAKARVTRILDDFGWETVDMGAVEAARAIEPLCMLWCIPGFLRNEWTHAFKLLRTP